MEMVLSPDWTSCPPEGECSSYLSLVGLLQLHFVQLDLLIMLISQILQGLSHFVLILLLATGVHFDQAMLMPLSCLSYLLHREKEDKVLH